MNNFITDWIKKHWSSIAIGLILCWFSIGVNYAVFLKPSIKVGDGGKYYEATQGYSPFIGLAAGDMYFGCAHMKARSIKANK